MNIDVTNIVKKVAERCAAICEEEAERVLALQTKKGGNMEDSIDTNLRMIAILLPDVAEKIRKEFKVTP